MFAGARYKGNFRQAVAPVLHFLLITMKRVLLTGITGFVGPHVALFFLDRGWTVRATTRSSAKSEAVLELPLLRPYAQTGALEAIVVCSVETGDFGAALEGVDAVSKCWSRNLLILMPGGPFSISVSLQGHAVGKGLSGTRSCRNHKHYPPSRCGEINPGSLHPVLLCGDGRDAGFGL